MIEGVIGGRVLLPDGNISETNLCIDDGAITQIGGRGRGLDARGMLVLPGLVDLHGDAFERSLMPRPRVHFPLDMALLDTDLQLLAHGVTTAFHGITCSWEGGLRGTGQAASLIDAIAGTRLPLAADHRIHLRFETYHLDAVGQVVEWIERGLIDFLAFNDHLEDIRRKSANGGIAQYMERSGLGEADFRALIERTAARSDEVPAAINHVAAQAGAAGLALASHDDYSEQDRHWYHERGCAVSEFPRTQAAMQAARALGNHIVMGAPNVVRGGSHCKAVNATEAVAGSMCDVLASDYYYPSLVSAPFRLAREGITNFGRAWSLVSRNPARAAGLADRGEIRVGQRADLVLIDDSEPAWPRVIATVIAGQLKFGLRALALQ